MNIRFDELTAWTTEGDIFMDMTPHCHFVTSQKVIIFPVVRF
jgi:hypothetical protein